jgi:hypothetical protein
MRGDKMTENYDLEKRKQKQEEWRESYLASSRAFYESLEKRGINTSAEKVVRVSEPPSIIWDIRRR